MTLFWIFLISILVIVGAGVRLLMTAVRWSHELTELERYGVETTGTVDRKISYHTRGGGRSRYIRYAYTDQFGKRHTRKTIVLGDTWEQSRRGAPSRSSTPSARRE